MSREADVAQAFLLEADADWRAAQLLAREEHFARAIAACQQVVEKVTKATLVMRGIYENSPSWPSGYAWTRPICPMPRVSRTSPSASSASGPRAAPLFGDPNRPIWVPSVSYGEADARQALEEAAFVFETLSHHLADEYGVAAHDGDPTTSPGTPSAGPASSPGD